MIRLLIIISLFLFSQNVSGQEVISITCIGNGDTTGEFYPGENFKIVGNTMIVQKITFSNDTIKSISSEILGGHQPKIEGKLYIIKQDNKPHIVNKGDIRYQLITNEVTEKKIEFYTYIHTKKIGLASYISTKIDRTTGVFKTQINVRKRNFWDVEIKDNKIKDNTTLIGTIYDAYGECKKTTNNKKF